MTPDDFIGRYECALASQKWSSVDPLVHDDVCVTFSSGSVHKGKAIVRAAFERNFSAIQEEKYRIANIHWVLRSREVAVYLFDFHWSGRIDGKEVRGAGRGTSVLILDGNDWKLLTEHLGPNSASSVIAAAGLLAGR